MLSVAVMAACSFWCARLLLLWARLDLRSAEKGPARLYGIQDQICVFCPLALPSSTSQINLYPLCQPNLLATTLTIICLRLGYCADGWTRGCQSGRAFDCDHVVRQGHEDACHTARSMSSTAATSLQRLVTLLQHIFYSSI